MKYRQKNIYCQNQTQSQITEKLERDLPKKCGLFIDGDIIILTSRLQQGGGDYSWVTGSIGVTIATQISAKIISSPLGSTVTITVGEADNVSKCTVLIMWAAVFIAWCISYVFHAVTKQTMDLPSSELALELTIGFAASFFIAYSIDKMVSEQRIKLIRYLEDVLKPSSPLEKEK